MELFKTARTALGAGSRRFKSSRPNQHFRKWKTRSAQEFLKVGDEVEAKFTGVDRKNRTISLSIKAKDQADEREAMDSLNQSAEEESGLSAMAEAFKNAKL